MSILDRDLLEVAERKLIRTELERAFSDVTNQLNYIGTYDKLPDPQDDLFKPGNIILVRSNFSAYVLVVTIEEATYKKK